MYFSRATTGLVAATALFALAACKDEDENKGNQPQETVRTEQNVQVAPAPAPAQPQQRTGDTLDEKAQKRAVIRANDTRFLSAMGYTGSVTQLGEGRNCEADGTVTGAWKGTATSMSYLVQRDGAQFRICLDHSGPDSRPAVGTGPVAVAAAAPAPQAVPGVTAPAPSAPATSGDPEKDAKRRVLRQQDAGFLRAQGFSGTVTQLGEGRNCEADGSVTGAWKGTATSTAYRAQKDGQTYQICINHSGPNSTPSLGTLAPAR